MNAHRNFNKRDAQVERHSGASRTRRLAGLALASTATLTLLAIGALPAFADETVSLADCKPAALHAPAVAPAGQSIVVEWTGADRGPGPMTSAWFDAILLSDKPAFDGTALVVGTYNNQVGIGSGGTYSESEAFTLPNVPPGDYFLILRVDYFNNIAETDEGNNDLAVPITIVSSASTPAPASAGANALKSATR